MSIKVKGFLKDVGGASVICHLYFGDDGAQ